MKKILLFTFCILSAACYAQIGSIETTGEKYNRVGQFMLNYPRTNRYILHLQDGIEEVNLNLGVGPNEAAMSLAHLYEVIYEDGKTFTLQGRRYNVNNQKVCVHDAYSLDGLCISGDEIKHEILVLIDNGADFGDLAITQGYTANGTYMLLFETYGFVEGIIVGVNVSERMSRKYNDFEKLDKEDVSVLRDAIRENYTSVTNGAIGMSICDVILGEY